ncbi:MAG: hypothetical protein ACR2IH_04665 [Pyrinomonadaceae bacterium]
MIKNEKDLGKVIGKFPVAAANIQRAAIVAATSFLFFLLMLGAFYIRQQIGYFILSSAFLIVYIFTMVGWWLQKRKIAKIHTDGFVYERFVCTWDEVESVSSPKAVGGMTIRTKSGRSITVPPSIDSISELFRLVSARIGR